MKSLMMIIIMLKSLILTCVGQNISDTISIKRLPILNGYVLKDERIAIPNGWRYDGIVVYSSTDSVFNIKEGVVYAISDYDNDTNIVVKSGNTFIYYADLNSIAFKHGDRIERGQFLGKTSYSKFTKNYCLGLSIQYNKKNLKREHLIKFLQKNDLK